MPRYRYLAAPAGGGGLRETALEADSPAEALSRLRSCGLRPVRYLGEEGARTSSPFLRRGGGRADCHEFTSKLAPLLAASIPLERALAIIAESSDAPAMRDLALSLRQGLHEGKKFSSLIRSRAGTFPGFYSNLIESGEETGCLPEAVEELRRFLSESRETRDFIVSSSIYPAAVLGVTIAVAIVMFTVFVPRFSAVFTDMGREQPPSMIFLNGLSTVLAHACWLLPLTAAAAWSVASYCMGAEQFRQWRSGMLTRIPVFGKILVEVEIGRFVRTLAILIGNHVEIIKTVRIAGRVIQNQVIRASFSGLEAKLRSGEKLSAALAGNRFLPPGFPSQIRVGEESGSVGPMLARSAEQLEENTRRKIKRLLSLFEPAVIVFLALMVLVVVVSIFLAILEVNQVD